MPDHRLARFERVVDTYRKTARRSSHDYAFQQDTSDLHLDRLAGSGRAIPLNSQATRGDVEDRLPSGFPAPANAGTFAAS